MTQAEDHYTVSLQLSKWARTITILKKFLFIDACNFLYLILENAQCFGNVATEECTVGSKDIHMSCRRLDWQLRSPPRPSGIGRFGVSHVGRTSLIPLHSLIKIA